MVAALTSVIGRRGDAASAALVERIFLAAREGGEPLGGAAWSCAIGAMCRFYTLVPIRPRSRGERRSLRTLPIFSLRPALAFNTRPQRLSTPSDAFQLHPDVRLYRTALRVGETDRRHDREDVVVGERVEARAREETQARQAPRGEGSERSEGSRRDG